MAEPLPFDVIPLEDRWLTRAEAAVIARVNPATISRAVVNGELSHVRVRNGRSLRFRRAWIDEWLTRGFKAAA